MRISDWSSDVCSSDLVREDATILGDVRQAEAIDGMGLEADQRGAVVGDAALATIDQPHDRPQRRRLPRAVAAEQRQDLAGPELERHVVQDMVQAVIGIRSEEHTSELQSLMRNSYAVFCLNKKILHWTVNNKKPQSTIL